MLLNVDTANNGYFLNHTLVCSKTVLNSIPMFITAVTLYASVAVKITGAKNIKQYHGDQLTILNPCLVSRITYVV